LGLKLIAMPSKTARLKKQKAPQILPKNFVQYFFSGFALPPNTKLPTYATHK
jgi:hypothetical protein